MTTPSAGESHKQEERKVRTEWDWDKCTFGRAVVKTREDNLKCGHGGWSKLTQQMLVPFLVLLFWIWTVLKVFIEFVIILPYLFLFLNFPFLFFDFPIFYFQSGLPLVTPPFSQFSGQN